MKEKKELTVKCPSCEKKFNYYSGDFRPFCSERCKMVDAGHWFDESYAIKGRDNSVYIEDPEQMQKLVEDDADEYY